MADFLRLLLYVTFFCVLCKLYSMPIHIIRDVAMVARSFYRRVTDFIKYRHATRDMHARYPDATAEEITTQDVCIICREGMTARPEAPAQAQAEPTAPSILDERLRPKKLPCGHILHFACLRSWLERQQNCPTCRQPVLSNPTPPQPGRDANAPVNNNPAGVQQAQANPNQIPAANAVPPNAQLNRIRTFSLGPLRLTIGTGRIIQGLPAAGVNQPNQPPVVDPNTRSNHTILPPVPSMQASGLSMSSALPESNTGVIQASINHLERMLMQDTVRLRLQTEQMNVLRAMQAELTRLRISQGIQQQSLGSIPTTGNTTPTFPGVSVPPVSAFTSNHNSEPIRSGGVNLPAGVTIPEGWTLLPLQRLQDQTAVQPLATSTITSQPQQRSRSLGPSSQPLPATHVTPGATNISSLPVQRHFSTPSEVPIRVTTDTPSLTVTQVNSATTNSPPADPNNSKAKASSGPEATASASSEQPPTQSRTPAGTESTREPSRTRPWEWPTTTLPRTPMSNESPKSEQGSSQQSSPDQTGAARDHATTVEDASEEEQEQQ